MERIKAAAEVAREDSPVHRFELTAIENPLAEGTRIKSTVDTVVGVDLDGYLGLVGTVVEAEEFGTGDWAWAMVQFDHDPEAHFDDVPVWAWPREDLELL